MSLFRIRVPFAAAAAVSLAAVLVAQPAANAQSPVLASGQPKTVIVVMSGSCTAVAAALRRRCFVRRTGAGPGPAAERRGDGPVDYEPDRHHYRQCLAGGGPGPVVVPGCFASGARRDHTVGTTRCTWSEPVFSARAGRRPGVDVARPSERYLRHAAVARARPRRPSRRSMPQRPGRSALTEPG